MKTPGARLIEEIKYLSYVRDVGGKLLRVQVTVDNEKMDRYIQRVFDEYEGESRGFTEFCEVGVTVEVKHAG